ncbi:tyrosine-type recombinase/integrase [Cellulosimicrobium sp. CpK407]|uniref:tyrosine-type recombinase/integrase n=1 Tax=Cellulosimicrobium sp. CpK407 TaxID=3229847 RepID=UPI003F2F4A19
MSVKKRVYRDEGGVERIVWRARTWTYPPHGSRREVSRSFKTRREAVAWEREQALLSRGRTVEIERLRLRDAGLWERAEPVLRSRLAPKTLDHYRRGYIGRVLVTLGDVRVGDLSVGDVERAMATWQAAGAGGSTVRQARLALSAVLSVAVRDGLLRANPARDARRQAGDVGARSPRRVGDTLTPKQLRRLVLTVRQSAGEPYATMLDVMASCGLRYGEVAALRCRDVDLVAGVVHVRRSVTEVSVDDGSVPRDRVRDGNLVWGPPKGGRERVTVLPAHLVTVLTARVEGRRPDDLVFVSVRSGRVLGQAQKMQRPVRRNTFARATKWQRTTTELGYAGLRIHDLRACFITNSLAAGVPPHVVREMAGHHDLTVTNGYARAHDDALSRAARRLDDWYESA